MEGVERVLFKYLEITFIEENVKKRRSIGGGNAKSSMSVAKKTRKEEEENASRPVTAAAGKYLVCKICAPFWDEMSDKHQKSSNDVMTI